RLIARIPRDAKEIAFTVGLVPATLDDMMIIACSSHGLYYEGVRESGEQFRGHVRSRFSSFSGLRTIAQEAWAYFTSRGYNCRINREETTERESWIS
ncbi:MAG: hypothetical protein KKB21_05085, partial [Nanoarchaeota archaeon]|nr:hypothetical protein [Nanoarchaeota archaeon]